MTIDTINNDIAEVEAMRRKLHIYQLKTAAKGLKEESSRRDTKSIAVSVVWAVEQLEGKV